ncbi:hypothetical protein OHC33_006336 [Knufia fluminis]|uniref:phospholipase A2 n=1 Tax=Knufia fluminis TaxID=191047 RepID=A0AAN8EDC2_9EURO|nr:hypothetical protein OHC33_006336 [Knufia fluminis]
MTGLRVHEPRSYGATTISGPAAAHLGDVNDHSTNYIQDAHFYFNGVPPQPNSSIRALADRPYLARSGKGLALLVFDGGIVGGLSDLYMLKHFMGRVARIAHLHHTPKPCEFFDMISGASVGGLLAVLLGSLELSVDECIEKYLHICSELSKDNPYFNGLSTTEKATRTLVSVTKRILRERAMSENKLLEAPHAVACKVFVQANNALRSYKIRTNEDIRLRHVKIWQAVQATFATSGAYDAVSINDGTSNTLYGLSSHASKNLLIDTWHEAQSVLVDSDQRLEDHLDCIVSVGTKFLSSSESGHGDLMAISTRISSLNDAAYTSFADQHPNLVVSSRLCRLQFTFGHRNAIPSEHAESVGISQALRSFLVSSEMANRLAACAERAAVHQVTPGFSLLRASPQPVSLHGNQPSMTSVADLVSDYDARAAQWQRSFPRVRDTCSWVFADAVFVKWIRTPGISLLSCVGTVGCGKSFLAAAVVDHFHELRSAKLQACIHYFVDSGKTGPKSLDSMLRGIIKQLILCHDEAMSPMSPALQAEVRATFQSNSLPPTVDGLKTLVQKMADETPGVLYLIDGFDEMAEQQIQQLFVALRNIFRDSASHGSKLIIFSRETLGKGISVRKQLSVLAQVFYIRLSLKQLSGDISRFVEALVDEKQLMRNITEDENLLLDIKSKLKAHGDKMFLWIHLQVQNIWELSPEQSENDRMIRELLDQLPKGLDETYIQCLRRTVRHQVVASRAFKWISSAKRPLTSQQLREAVSMEPSNVELEKADILNSCVTEYCSNLISFDLTRRGIDFFHVSVKQFLQDPDRLPEDLAAYRLEQNKDDHWCLAICLAYLKLQQIKKQLVQVREGGVPGNISRTVLQDVPGGSTATALSRFFSKRTTTPGHVHRLPMPKVARVFVPAELEMHQYITAHWLSHATTITQADAIYGAFSDMCISLDCEAFAWLGSTAAGAEMYKALLHYAILQRHEPLLQLLATHLKTKTKKTRESVFESPCPGTSVRLIHVAAALGHIEAVKVLERVSTLHTFDDDGKTPLAWAAANSQHMVVAYLVRTAKVNTAACQKFKVNKKVTKIPRGVYRSHEEIVVPLTALLAAHEDSSGFWSLMNQGKESYKQCLAPHPLTLAWTTACLQGNFAIAEHLQKLGGSLDTDVSCIHPLSHNANVGSPLELAIAHKKHGMHLVLQLGIAPLSQSMAKMSDEICTSYISKILALSGDEISVVWQALCTDRCIRILRSSLFLAWHQKIFSSCGHPCIQEHRAWMDAIRNVLHYENKNCPVDATSSLRAHPGGEIFFFSNWLERLPDDLLVLLIRLKYLARPTSALSNVLEQGSDDWIFMLSHRISSRPLAATSYSCQDEGWRNPLSLQTASWIGAKDVVEYIVHIHSQSLGVPVDRCIWIGEWCLPTTLEIARMPQPSQLQIDDLVARVRQARQSGANICAPSPLVASRCLRRCANDTAKALRMYRDLSEGRRGTTIPDADMSLNFPAGYWMVGHKYAVKLSIVGALYRWNWRLRRESGRPLSAADKAYMLAVPEVFGFPWPGPGPTKSNIGQAYAIRCNVRYI